MENPKGDGNGGQSAGEYQQGNLNRENGKPQRGRKLNNSLNLLKICV